MGPGLAAMAPLQLLVLETLVVSALLLTLFRLRPQLGLSPLYITIGALQHIQVLLSLSVYVEPWPGLIVSPGSVVLFTGSLFALLLVYLREGVREARRFIYGLSIANLTASLLGMLFALHIEAPGTRNPLALPRELFLGEPRALTLGTAVLFVDLFLVVLVYEVSSRLLGGRALLRIFVTMAVVLTIDTLLFVNAVFPDRQGDEALLFSGILGKLGAAFVYTLTFYAYLRWFDAVQPLPPGLRPRIRDVFQFLTYRERYEVLSRQMTRDPLTGAHNRAFLDDTLKREIEVARRSGSPLTVLMLDIDGFKLFNDSHGHLEGDRVLKLVARAAEAALRSIDLVCRYGGEEFVVLAPKATAQQAAVLAERIREQLARLAEVERQSGRHGVTLTIGVASFPADGETSEALLRVADRRMYVGKRAGRDRVVASDADAV